MDTVATAGIIFACILGSALLGLWLNTRLPDHHLSSETKDVIKLVTGVAGSMAAIVLGLLVSAAKSSYDAQRAFVVQLSANTVMLDRTLAHYGPEAQESRRRLREAVTDMLARTWPETSTGAPRLNEEFTVHHRRHDDLYDSVQNLKATTDAQKNLQAQALKIISDTGQSRWLLHAQLNSSIPKPFLVLMVAWLSLLFASFGLFAPRNATAITTLLLGALIVSSAMFLILELDQPFNGIIQVPSQPMEHALSQLGQ